MSYQTSHGFGDGPFKPNKDRGVWSNPHDFAMACLNNAFRIDNVYGVVVVPLIVSNGFFAVVVWFLLALLYAVPMFFIQAFLGQFSSSGYISALRISPIFKGLGYIALITNLISLAFHGILIAVPMLFFIHSLQPTLPWSCDALRPLNKSVEVSINKSIYDMDLYRSHCNINISAINDDDFVILTIPSLEFFRDRVKDFNIDIFGCVLVIWAAVAFVVYNSSEKIGMFFRYGTIVLVSLLGIVFLRMLFLPGILQSIGTPKPYHTDSWVMWIILPTITTFTTFGPGWGSVLSLASYNKFKTNLINYSWQIPLCQLGVMMLLGMVSDFAEVHLTSDHQHFLSPFSDLQWMSFMTIPSTLAAMEYPHFWTWMFLIMIILGSFNLMLIQMFSVQTAVFDEFEQLRPFRKEVIFGSAAVLALVSTFFCTLNGLNVIEMVVDMNLFSQCFLNLILILVVLWVYGRERLQRDVEFMTSKALSDWIFHYVRFAAPVFLGLMMLIAVVFGLYYHTSSDEFQFICVFVIFLPWVALPTYCAFRLRQATGDWKLRLSRCIKPIDWHPVDAEDKDRYDETFGSQEASHVLTTIVL